ncbi:hypothetical protein F5148DRAFT_504776 [Russula earlei]|uniref:Uncharacterized protein n=1 Tax=Russula earlei TaxID=71964 RepID=A0ACC0TXV2_9AGAM|nr:hypothetical protein F5148DRAFT_504776 [Russula earlei]
MCVGFWSLTHPEYALILCANRDEDLSRATLPAHFHSFEALSEPASSAANDGGAAVKDDVKARASVLSGRDVLAGGSWLGISKPTGRVALLTNITEAGAAYASSRGTLIASFLADPRGRQSDSDRDIASAAAALTSSQPGDAPYAGFNMLLFEPLTPPAPTPTPLTGSSPCALAYDARWLTNGGGGGRIRARPLSDAECACGGISNGVDGEGGDAWPKLLQGKAALRSILDEDSPHCGPEITDPDSHLAGRLIELLT